MMSLSKALSDVPIVVKTWTATMSALLATPFGGLEGSFVELMPVAMPATCVP